MRNTIRAVISLIATGAFYGLGYVTLNVLMGLLFGTLALAGLMGDEFVQEVQDFRVEPPAALVVGHYIIVILMLVPSYFFFKWTWKKTDRS